MSDALTTNRRSYLMSRVRGRGNEATELKLLALLRRNKISGWRRHLQLHGKPDFAFTKQKVAVFVDGCFWHGCPKCYTRPKTNRKFWDKKRQDNMARDKRVNRQLRRQGWKVIRIWQLPSAVYAALRLSCSRINPLKPASSASAGHLSQPPKPCAS